MNLYFRFFNKEKSEYVKIDKNTTAVKTNLENFNLKVFELESHVDLKNVTETTLVIEKENKGLYYHFKTVSGEYDAYEKSFNFKDVKLSTEDISSKFKIVLEFKEGGITVFNTKENYKELFFKPSTEDFEIDIHDAKRIHDVFELQNENDVNLSFDISVSSETTNTTLQCRYWFDKNQESEGVGGFEPLGISNKSFSTPMNIIQFHENQTFLFIELKDVFGNIRKKKYRILAPRNTYSLFEIFNEPIVINSFETAFKIFVDYRNCSKIRPVINYFVEKTERSLVSEKVFGEAYYENNVFDVKLSDLFNINDLSSAAKFKLRFILNDYEESSSGDLEIVVDNKKPIIKLSNLDEENYALIVEDKNKEQVNGMIFDESLFFIGSENRKCSFDNVTDKVFIYSETSLKSIRFENGETPYLYSYGNYYLAEDKRCSFTISNDDGIVGSDKYSVIRHVPTNGNKHFYMIIDKNKLSNYEKNIIENQGGLLLKGPLSTLVTKQEFSKFSKFYILTVEVPNTVVDKYQFTLGIPEFEYDFSKFIYDSNVSCKLSQSKELIMDFTSTRIVFIASKNETSVMLFNSTKKLKNMKTYSVGEISFFALSKNNDEFFTTSDSVTFVDQHLNTLPFEKIHLVPKIVNEKGSSINIENFTMTEISNVDEKSYNISFDIPISEGENMFTMEVADGTSSSDNVSFILEKNTKVVEVKTQDSEMTDSEIFVDQDKTVHLVNNKDLCFVKLIVFNETRKEKASEKYILVNNGSKTEKHRILTKDGIRYVALYLSNNNEKTNYSITYDSYSDELMKITTTKQDNLFIKVEDSFIAGSNYYHLNYFKDEFSTVSIEHTNRQNFKCELHDKYVEITRIRNTNFIEDITLTITVNDRNGNYAHSTKSIKGKFYNETVISDYYVDKAINTGGKIDEPMFDLVIKSQDVENVLYMSVYDKAELNVYKRKKVAYYNSSEECYRFSGITSPITPSSILVNIHLKGEEQLVLEKAIFNNENIFYSKNTNKVLTTSSKTNDDIIFEFNTSEDDETYKSLEIYVNDVVISKKENVVISVNAPVIEKIKIEDLPLMSRIYCKFINSKGMISYSNNYNFDFNIKASKVSVSHNFDKMLLQTIEANTFYVGNFESKTIIVTAIDSLGNSTQRTLVKGDQILDIFKQGEIYKVKLSIKDKNALRTFYQGTIQVYNEISDIIELKDTLFERIKYNKTVTLKNESLINSNELNCFLSHYVNGNLVKSYPPIINSKEISFKITKMSGINKLIFNYNNEKLDISTFEFKATTYEEKAIYDIKINNNVIYSKSGKEYILTEPADVVMKTKGLRYLYIKSEPMGRVIEKTVADNFVCRIDKSWIPCTINAADEYKQPVKLEEISIKKIKNNIFSFKIGSNIARSTSKMTFNLSQSNPVFKENRYKCKIGYYMFHKFYSYANSFASSIGKADWFKLEKVERNNIIKEITCGVFDEAEIKKIIRKYLGGN